MKRIILGISLLLLSSLTLVAQNNRGQIKALKTAFITNALELSPSEAEKFWPIYNQFDQNMHKFKAVKTQQIARTIRLAGGIEKLSESESERILKEFIDIDYNVANEKKNLHKNLTGIISSKKIIKLLRAEQNFNKELLKRLREKRLKRN
jgi:hypothetical protein